MKDAYSLACWMLLWSLSLDGGPRLSAQELITNGSFEQTEPGFVPDANNVMSLAPGAAAIPGWTTAQAEVVWGSNSNPFGPKTLHGELFIDLTGYHDNLPYGGISQTVATTPGERYRLSFDLGVNQADARYRGPASVAVLIGAETNTFTFSPAFSGNQWGTFTMDAPATGPNTTVQIIGSTAAAGRYIGLDNVSLTVLPEARELLVNGSFEDTVGGFPFPANGAASLPVGSTTIPGWTTINAELAWVTNSNPFQIATWYGEEFVDLTGYHDGAPYGGVSQTVTTVAGQTLRLSFSLGSQQDFADFRGPVGATVILGAQTNTFTFSVPNLTNVWETFTLEFAAASSTTPISIVGTSAAGGAYIGLDNVSLRPLTGEFRITRTDKVGDSLVLTFNSDLNAQYALQSRDEFVGGAWAPLSGVTAAGTGAPVQVTVPNAFGTSRRFYRIQKLP